MSNGAQIEILMEGQRLPVKAGERILELMKRYPPKHGKPLAAKINQHLVSLDTPVRSGCRVTPVDYTQREGTAVYRRSACLILYEAVEELYPHARVVVGQSLAGGYYFDIVADPPLEADHPRPHRGADAPDRAGEPALPPPGPHQRGGEGILRGRGLRGQGEAPHDHPLDRGPAGGLRCVQGHPVRACRALHRLHRPVRHRALSPRFRAPVSREPAARPSARRIHGAPALQDLQGRPRPGTGSWAW